MSREEWHGAELGQGYKNDQVVQEEWDDMVVYAKQYLNLVQQDYKVVWWKPFSAVDAKKWSNVWLSLSCCFAFQ